MSVKNDIATNRNGDISLTFIVTAYNEEDGLISSIDTIDRAVGGRFIYEIIIVDDASKDRSFEIANRLAATRKDIRPIRHFRNLGLGAAYKTGVANARMSYVMWIAGDDAWPESGLRDCFKQIGTVDIVIPYITKYGDKTETRKAISKIYTAIINAVFRLNVPYFNGIVIHKREIIQSVPIMTNGFAYQAEALIRLLRRGHSFVTVPSFTKKRIGGESDAFRIINVLSVVGTIMRLALTEGLKRKSN